MVIYFFCSLLPTTWTWSRGRSRRHILLRGRGRDGQGLGHRSAEITLDCQEDGGWLEERAASAGDFAQGNEFGIFEAYVVIDERVE